MSSSSAMTLWLLVSLTACNQIYGLDPTSAAPPIDAQYFDAPIDAPFSCPPNGTTPRFDRLLHQPIIQLCTDYTISGTGRAIAGCDDLVVGEGPPDMPLLGTTGFTAPAGQTLVTPRISPEGDEAFAVLVTNRSVPAEIHAYRAQGAATWSHEYAVQMPFVLSPSARIGVPTIGPSRRMMVLSSGVIYEVSIDAAGVATIHDTYAPADLGLGLVSGGPNLSPDGLRMVVPGIATTGAIQHALYSDRASLSERFRPADPIDAFAFASDPFMTPDCGRIYFSAVESILFVQRGP